MKLRNPFKVVREALKRSSLLKMTPPPHRLPPPYPVLASVPKLMPIPKPVYGPAYGVAGGGLSGPPGMIDPAGMAPNVQTEFGPEEGVEIPKGARVERYVKSLEAAALLQRSFRVPWCVFPLRARYEGTKIVIETAILDPDDVDEPLKWKETDSLTAAMARDYITQGNARWWKPIIIEPPNDETPKTEPKSEGNDLDTD